MPRTKHTTSARETYFHPDDPAGWLKPGESFIVDGLDWSWAFVIYRDVPDFPGYCVGSNGTVWSRWVRIGRADHRGTDFILGQNWTMRSLGRRGSYLRVDLHRDKQGHPFDIHRLVLMVFVGPCPPGMECLHRDDNPRNNRLANIRWGTRADNSRDAARNGHTPKGENHWQTKSSEADVVAIREAYAAGATAKELGLRYGLHFKNIVRIASGRVWSHVGGPITKRGRGCNKISGEVAAGIREAIAGGMTIAKTAERFGVGVVTVDSIIHRRHAWRDR